MKIKDIDNTMYPSKIANHIVKKQNKEIERLNNIIKQKDNIIDGIEKELKKGMDVYVCNASYGKTFKSIESVVRSYYLNKLKELKGDD